MLLIGHLAMSVLLIEDAYSIDDLAQYFGSHRHLQQWQHQKKLCTFK